MVPLSRQEIVLAGLAAAGENATLSPVQVQKLFFLLDREASELTGGPHFRFHPYDYGPFDSAVYDELSIQGLMNNVQVSGSGKYRIYGLTPQGFAHEQRLLSDMPAETADFLRRAAAWIRGLNFRQLVSAIYDAYPDMKANSIFRG